jgi:hypothetical protein
MDRGRPGAEGPGAGRGEPGLRPRRRWEKVEWEKGHPFNRTPQSRGCPETRNERIQLPRGLQLTIADVRH